MIGERATAGAEIIEVQTLHYFMKDIEEKHVQSETRFTVITGVTVDMFLSTVLHRCTSSRQSGGSRPNNPAKPSHDRGSSNPFSAESCSALSICFCLDFAHSQS